MAARESHPGGTPKSALDWLIGDCVADLTFPAESTRKTSRRLHVHCPSVVTSQLSASSADDEPHGVAQEDHSRSRSPGSSLEFTPAPSAAEVAGLQSGAKLASTMPIPAAPQKERSQAPSPDSVMTAQHFSIQPSDMRMYNSGSETLVPDCLYDQQSMQPMHSEMHNIEEQLRGLSDKDAKRMRRRITNRESAMRMRRKRAQDHHAVMSELQAIQGENLRLKQVQVGSAELLHKMKREVLQWQVRAQNAQNQNAMLMKQMMEQQQVQYHAAPAARPRTLHQPKAEAALPPSAAAPAQYHRPHIRSQPAPKPILTKPPATSPSSAASSHRLQPAREALMTSIFEGRPLDLSPGLPAATPKDDLVQELMQDDADFVSMMQLLVGA